MDAAYVHVCPHEATKDTPPFQIKDHERRSVPMPKFAAEHVRELVKRKSAGNPYVFITPDRLKFIRSHWRKIRERGGQWQNRWMVYNVVRNLKARCKRAGIVSDGPINVHCLRKSYGRNGARCLSADALQAYMGHSNIATTLTYYSKRGADDDAQARWTLDALVRGEPMQNPKLSDVKVTFGRDSRESRNAG